MHITTSCMFLTCLHYILQSSSDRSLLFMQFVIMALRNMRKVLGLLQVEVVALRPHLHYQYYRLAVVQQWANQTQPVSSSSIQEPNWLEVVHKCYGSGVCVLCWKSWCKVHIGGPAGAALRTVRAVMAQWMHVDLRQSSPDHLRVSSVQFFQTLCFNLPEEISGILQ